MRTESVQSGVNTPRDRVVRMRFVDAERTGPDSTVEDTPCFREGIGQLDEGRPQRTRDVETGLLGG